MLHWLALGVALAGPVPAAIERSVQERMGDVRVVVVSMSGADRFEEARAPGRRCEDAVRRSAGPAGECRTAGTPDPGVRIPPLDVAREALSDGRRANRELTAIPEPGSRLGRPVRFILLSDGARVGAVVAEIEVTGPALLTTRAVGRGEALDAGTVDEGEVQLEHVLLRRLPTRADVSGATARRDIRKGEIVTDTAVLVPPTVRSGDEVRVSIGRGPVVVTGVGRASGSGRTGDLIRVLVPSSRKALNARITGPGAVEIVR